MPHSLNRIHKLTDEQLISLFRSNGIDIALKKEIINEIDRRDIVIKEVVQKELSFKKKISILFTSLFTYKYHVKESMGILISGNKKAYKKYWTFFTLGIAFYFFLLLIIGKYIIKPLFLKGS